MSKKRSGLRSICMSLLLVAALSFGRASMADGEPAPGVGEPLPPNILELIRLSGGEAAGSVALEAVVRPVIDGEVELEVLSPAGLRFASRARSRRFTLQRGGDVHRERLQVDLPALQPTVVRVRATLLKADGQPWLSLERELRFNQPSPDPARQRVPIVRTAPDGSRTVEYMEHGEAERRGLLRDRSAAPATAKQNGKASTVPRTGGDSPETPDAQE